MNSIPAKQFVNSIPSVLQAGAPSLGMNAIALTSDPSIPVGTLQGFGSAASVTSWFGAQSPEAAIGEVYFSAFNGATRLPSLLSFAQYNTSAVAAYLRGGSLAGMTLVQLQALAGTISVAVDGISIVSAAINLSSATSFSNAAALIQTGLRGGTPNNAVSCTYDALRQAFVITSSTTGGSSTLAYPTDSSLSPSLKLKAASGAVLSQGAAPAVPAALMDTLSGISQDWATFMTVTDPDNGAAGGPIKQQFATWNAAQGDAYTYVAFDSDATAAAGSDPSCFAQAIQALDGTVPVWSATQGALVAAFICGIAASIDFTAAGGRTTFAYRGSPALSPDITDLTTYLNLKGNGYNTYCNVATRTAQFQWLQPGSISGDWTWIDPYINQIYWNARFQNAFAELETQVKAIPYNQTGYNMIRQALAPEIAAMGSFGGWVSGVQLSGSQQVAVNTAAGLPIAAILQSQGWYLQVTDPGAEARAARQSPNCTFWYTDGGSVQQIVMGAVDLE